LIEARSSFLRVADFNSLEDLEERILAFIAEWNEEAHPFAWKRSSAGASSVHAYRQD